MSEPSLISSYLAALSAQLPAPVVEELAGGLGETRQRYLDQGLGPDAATRAAVAEFGDPDVIMAAFTRLSPARRAARRLLAAGPVVGGCWGLVLAGSRAWTWPVPVAGRVLFGAVLLSVIGFLAAAAFGREYRSVRRAGAAGCLGMTAVDTAVLLTITLITPTLIWPVILATAASAARLTFIARILRPVLTG